MCKEKECCKEKKNKKCKCKRKHPGYSAFIRFKTHKGGSFKISLQVTTGMVFTLFLCITGLVMLIAHAPAACKESLALPGECEGSDCCCKPAIKK